MVTPSRSRINHAFQGSNSKISRLRRARSARRGFILLDLDPRRDSRYLSLITSFRVFLIERGRIRISLAFQGVRRLQYAVRWPEPLKKYLKISIFRTSKTLDDDSPCVCTMIPLWTMMTANNSVFKNERSRHVNRLQKISIFPLPPYLPLSR